MSKHTYGFPAGTDKAKAIASAKQQAVADGYAADVDSCSAEVIESDAHKTDTPDVVHRGGKEHLVPHLPEFVVVVRGSGIRVG